MGRGGAFNSLDRVDNDRVQDMDSGGSFWDLSFGDSYINNIGNNVINIFLLVQVVVGKRSCNGQSGSEESEDSGGTHLE